MLTTFTTPVHHDVVLFGEVARPLLLAMGLGERARGVLAVEDIPATLRALEERLAEADARAVSAPDEGLQDVDDDDDEDDDDEPVPVSLQTRALPLLDLLRAALREGEDVSWESR